MALSSAQRKALAARGHHLEPSVTVGERDVSDAAAEHVRRQFERTDLIKVRVNTRDRDVFGVVVDQLAKRAGCEVVRRIGRVALLYRPMAASKGGEEM